MQRKRLYFKFLAIVTAFACALFIVGPVNVFAAEGDAAKTTTTEAQSPNVTKEAVALKGGAKGISGLAIAGIVIGATVIFAGLAASTSGGTTGEHP